MADHFSGSGTPLAELQEALEGRMKTWAEEDPESHANHMASLPEGPLRDFLMRPPGEPPPEEQPKEEAP